MKKFKLPMIIAVILTFGFINKSNAQKQSGGLYLTANDFLNHKLSYTNDQTNPNQNAIHIHEFLGRNNVTVISNGKKIVLPKSEIFGYRDSNGNDYRFYDNKAYQVLDTTGFYMYSYEKLIQEGKGPKPTRVYYFSKKSNDKIVPLSPEYIAWAYPQNYKLRYMVEVAAKTDIRLDTYDKDLNMYKIKELYISSLK